MSPALLVVTVAVALAVLAVVLSQIQARVALVEVTLNEGLPPGHEPIGVPSAQAPTIGGVADVTAALGRGTHVFLSRTCHACQRLVAELGERPVDLDDLRFHFVDRPRPLARDVALANRARLDEAQDDLALAVGADPLPFTIAIGDHDLVVRSVTPTRADLLAACRQAGLSVGSRR